MPALQFRQTGDAVKALQRGLNKLGSMLLVDGSYGPGTRDAVGEARAALNRPGPADSADEALQQTLADLPDPFPQLTAAGVTFIARCEVSDAARYRREFQAPCLPPGDSGITIGIGYDCRFVDASELQADWGGVLPAAMLDALGPVLGKGGTPSLLDQVKHVRVPLLAAMHVYVKRSLPKHIGQTRRAFPQVDALAPARQTALVSLVFNRGPSMTDPQDQPGRRAEMRAIRDALQAARLDAVPTQLESMTRLWDPAREGGLIARRHEEATLWRSGFGALNLD